VADWEGRGRVGRTSQGARRRFGRLEFTRRRKTDICVPGKSRAILSLSQSEESGVSVEEKVIGIVSEQLQIPKEEISPDKSFVDDLKADSLDVVELVMEFEDVFKITIPDEDYEKIKTVGDAVKYIEEKQ
jgi:acyl carrier protein